MRLFLVLISVLVLVLVLVELSAQWRPNVGGERESRAFIELIKEVEREYSDLRGPRECDRLWGLGFVENLHKSRKRVCSKLHTYDFEKFGLVLFRNVSVWSASRRTRARNTPYVDAQLAIEGLCPIRRKPDLDGYREFLNASAFPKAQQCFGEYRDEVLFVIPWFDSANWWHFLQQALFPGFFYYAAIQGEIVRETRNVRVVTLRWPEREAYNLRAPEVYPSWVTLPEILERMIGGPLRITPKEPFAGECYRALALVKPDPRHLDIAALNAGPKCFSSVFRAAADLVRGLFGAVHISRTKRVIYMQRLADETWSSHQKARNVRDQTAFLERLRIGVESLNAELEVAEFYYRDMVSVSEQILAVAHSQIMVGVHGAGLGSMIALPPRSAVVELRLDSANRHFEHLSALLGHSYAPIHYRSGRLDAGDADKVVREIVKFIK